MSTEAKQSGASIAPTDYNFGVESNFNFARAVTCNNDAARKLFARGLSFMFNYNHEEAINCFTQCANADDKCAMAWWGIAYCLSSSYNWPPGLGSGFDAITKAASLKDNASQLEQDLISALATRSSQEARDTADPTKLSFGNKPELNLAFVAAMQQVYAKYPGNLDVAAIYVEGLMNLKPWKLWIKDSKTGTVEPADDNTLLLVKTLEDNFKLPGGTSHPALCHLYIHALELSPFPEKALPAATMLRTLSPDSGHLVHMPSHIYANVGMWKDGVDCNEDGVAADDKYVKQSGNDSMFYKFYRMHNHHFVVWCAMFEGQYSKALQYARKIEAQLPAGDKDSGVQFMLSGVIPMGAVFLEAYVTSVWHVMVRFGKWDDIIAEPMRTDKKVFAATVATQHYARGVAYASKGMVTEAEAEQKLFRQALANPALQGRLLHNNKMYQDPKDGPSILAVQAAILDGEIEYRRQFLAKANGEQADFKQAFDILRGAVQLDLNLAYDEPWGHMQPVRHILGALLMEQKQMEEAEAVYRADLKTWKNNMWSLLGLKLCLEAKPTTPEVALELASVTEQHAAAAARADIMPKRTCFCAQAAQAQSTTGKTAE